MNPDAIGYFWRDLPRKGELPPGQASANPLLETMAKAKAAAFGARTPRNILGRSSPRPYELSEAPWPIAQLAHAFSVATGIDSGAMIVALTTAAGAIIDDRYQLEVNSGSDWRVSARQMLCRTAQDCP